jgi:hypothetical protein
MFGEKLRGPGMNLTARKTPWHIWAVGIISLLWNFGGVLDYSMTHFQVESYMSQFTPEQLDYFYSFPAWSVAFWALGVWGAFAGSFLILLRSRFATLSFGISIIGLLGSTIYQFGVADMPDSIATIGTKAFTAIIWLSVILLYKYCSRMQRAGVLR